MCAVSEIMYKGVPIIIRLGYVENSIAIDEYEGTQEFKDNVSYLTNEFEIREQLNLFSKDEIVDIIIEIIKNGDEV